MSDYTIVTIVSLAYLGAISKTANVSWAKRSGISSFNFFLRAAFRKIRVFLNLSGTFPNLYPPNELLITGSFSFVNRICLC